MDTFLLSLVPAGADPRIGKMLALVLAHKGWAAAALFVGSGMGARVLVGLLNRLPMEWWYSLLRTIAMLVGAAGRKRFTRTLWRPFEEWFENFLGKSVDAIREGLDEDDACEAREWAQSSQGGHPGPLPPPLESLPASPESAPAPPAGIS